MKKKMKKSVLSLALASSVLMLSAAAFGAPQKTTSDAAKIAPLNNATPLWVAVQWSENDKEPIVLPVISTSKADCEKVVAEIDEVTKSTIGVVRQHACQTVLANTQKLRAYIKAAN